MELKLSIILVSLLVLFVQVTTNIWHYSKRHDVEMMLPIFGVIMVISLLTLLLPVWTMFPYMLIMLLLMVWWNINYINVAWLTMLYTIVMLIVTFMLF